MEEMTHNLNVIPNVKGEMDEIKRVSQQITRNDNFPVSVDEVRKSFKKVGAEPLTKEIWDKLENTESNTIQKGEFEKVIKISKMFNKSNPYKLRLKIAEDTYERPLIVKFGERYHLVSGNTRLCTAASMGITPMVFIGDLNKKKKKKGKGLNESTVLSTNGNPLKLNTEVREKLHRVWGLLGMGSKVEKHLDNGHTVNLNPYKIDFHGGVDETIKKVKENYMGKLSNYECGGYSLSFYMADIILNSLEDWDDFYILVSLSPDSDVSLFDGTEHNIGDIFSDGWDRENGYEDGESFGHVSNDIEGEIKECLKDYFRRELTSKYGVEFNELDFNVPKTGLEWNLSSK